MVMYLKAGIFNEKTKHKVYANEFSWAQKIILNALVEGQNHLAEKCNPMYEEWNARFDELYPHDEEDRTDPDSKYMSYIRNKQNRMLSDLKPKSPFVYSYYSNDECSIAVNTFFGNYSLILEPVYE